jgi:hypothetical protein
MRGFKLAQLHGANDRQDVVSNNLRISLAGLCRAVVLHVVIEPTLEKFTNRHCGRLDIRSFANLAQRSR